MEKCEKELKRLKGLSMLEWIYYIHWKTYQLVISLKRA